MLLANEFVHDTRVYKQARSLVECGCEVHVIAMVGRGLPLTQRQDGIHVHRVARRTGSLALLAVAVVSWWCRPILRRLFPGSAANGANELNHDATQVFARRLRAAIGSLWRATRFAASRVWALFLFLFGSPAVIALQRWLKRLLPASLRLLAFNVQCTRKALSLRPDIIQSHDLNTLVAGALVKRLTGVPLVYDSHELFLERNLGSRSRARDKIIWAPIERFCIRRCDSVFSVSDGICRHLARQYGIPKPHLIRNVQPYEPPPAKSKILSDELDIPHDKAVVLYAGAITFNRGLEAMIDSAKHLNGAVYVIMGYARNPKYLASLKRRAEEIGELNRRVFFREAVPSPQVVQYAASADLGIVPTQNVCLSYYYESSNKIFHCLMAGVPLVMSDHAEKRLLVEQYGIGALFDETDPLDIARVINETLADREAYDRMCRQCLIAARTLNWEHEEQKLRRIFADLLGNSVPAPSDVALSGLDQTVLEPEQTSAVLPAR